MCPAVPARYRRHVGRARAVAGGGHAVEIAPERLAGWYERFGARHGGVAGTVREPDEVVVTAADGATATCAVPFGPLTGAGSAGGLAVDPLVAHLLVPRRIGLLLVRLGGHSVGVARGGVVETSRTDRRLVPGRSAAGGWSQGRFARRRAGQAREALRSAADDAAGLLVPRLSELDGVVLGGDQRALDSLRADPRLAKLFALAQPRVLDVPEPRRTVLADAALRARCAEIVVRDAQNQEELVAKVHASASVPATPQRTWATAADLSRFGEWLSLHEGWRGEVPAEITEGTNLTSVVAVMGLRNRIRWHVERYAPPTALTISGRGVGGVKVALELRVRADGDGASTITVDAEVTGRPVFGPVSMAIGRAVRADLRKSVATLATMV